MITTILLALAPAVLQSTFPDTITGSQVPSFGSCVVADGDLLAIGASGFSGIFANRRPGRVSLYDMSSGAPVFVAHLEGTGIGIGDGFGVSIDVDVWQGVVVVGAPRANSNRGAAFVFERSASGAWSEVARFDGALGREAFGSAVAVEGGVAVVGQPDFDGGVRILQRSALGWADAGDLALPATVFQGAEFGAAIALDGGLLAVGAPGDDTLGYDSGAVYVYGQTSTSTFEFASRVEHPSAATVTRHGVDVALDVGNATARLLVGSGDDRAFMWQTVGFAPFVELAEITPYNAGISGGGYGTSVDLDGERAVLGAPWGQGGTSSSGAAFPLALDGGGSIVRPLSMLHSAAGGTVGFDAQFGDDVAVTYEWLFVGAPRVGPFGTVFVYSTGQRHGEAYCRGETNSTSGVASLAVRGSEFAADQDLSLEAAGLPAGATSLPIAAPLRDFVPNVGGGMGNLCVGGAIVRLNGLISFADSAGRMDVDVDFGALPPGIALFAGSRWCFQIWYRDNSPLPTSNTTDAVELLFR